MNDFLLYGNNIIVTVVKNVSTSFFGRDSVPLTKPTEPGTDLSKSLLNIGDIRQALGTSMDYGSDKAKLVTASMFQQNINNTTCKVKQSIPSRILLLYNMISKEELAVWSLSEWWFVEWWSVYGHQERHWDRDVQVRSGVGMEWKLSWFTSPSSFQESVVTHRYIELWLSNTQTSNKLHTVQCPSLEESIMIIIFVLVLCQKNNLHCITNNKHLQSLWCSKTPEIFFLFYIFLFEVRTLEKTS